MSFRSFTTRRRSLAYGGRRYTVRPPTVAAVALFEEAFARHVPRLVEDATGDYAIDVRRVALDLSAHPAAARILEQVVETDVPVEEWPLAILASLSMGMCDPAEVARWFEVDASAPGRSAGEDWLETAVVGVADRFKVSPLEVAAWPFDAFLAVLAQMRAGVDESMEAGGLGKMDIRDVPGVVQFPGGAA